MIKEVIVVEGKADTRRLREVYGDIHTIETGGNALDERTLELIRHAQKTRGVIILTDPDYPGMRIRSLINERVPGCQNAYVDRASATDPRTKKVGVEHCSHEIIRNALTNLTEANPEPTTVTYRDLLALGYVGASYSQALRDKASQVLHLGHNNAKQFYRKVLLFNISYDTLKALRDDLAQRIGMTLNDG
ncbi:MAG TPA: ribonuclease M5 [Haloplasmataceae bacterium]